MLINGFSIYINPRNAGEMDDPDGEGCSGDPNCGDHLIIYIKVRNKKIDDLRFLVYGCVAAIATSSMTTKLAKGKTLEDALKITDEETITIGWKNIKNALRTRIDFIKKERGGYVYL